MKTVDVVVVGQGIAGILLTRQLQKAGNTVFAFDQADPAAASNHAAAILNPINLGKIVPAMRPEEMAEALEAYKDLSAFLQQEIASPLDLYAYLNTTTSVPVALQNLIRVANPLTLTELDRFFQRPEKTSLYVLKAWKINYPRLRQAWLGHLERTDQLCREAFDYAALAATPEGYTYKNLRFRKLVFCEGLGVRHNPYFRDIAFTKNRGDYLALEIPGLPADSIYHYGLRLVPQAEDRFWFGSNYRWDYDNLNPDEAWRIEALDRLRAWLKIPFQVLEHGVAERPTRAGQIPVLSEHPDHRGMYIFNGLGTKGFTLGPYLARQMMSLLSAKKP